MVTVTSDPASAHWLRASAFPQLSQTWPEQRAADGGMERAQAGGVMVQVLGGIRTGSVSTSSLSLSLKDECCRDRKWLRVCDCSGPPLQAPTHIFFGKIPCDILRSRVWVQRKESCPHLPEAGCGEGGGAQRTGWRWI